MNSGKEYHGVPRTNTTSTRGRAVEQQLASNGEEELAPRPHQLPHPHDGHEDPSAQKSDRHWHDGGACVTNSAQVRWTMICFCY